MHNNICMHDLIIMVKSIEHVQCLSMCVTFLWWHIHLHKHTGTDTNVTQDTDESTHTNTYKDTHTCVHILIQSTWINHTCKWVVALIFYPWQFCEQGLTAPLHKEIKYNITLPSSVPERIRVHKIIIMWIKLEHFQENKKQHKNNFFRNQLDRQVIKQSHTHAI